MKPMSENINPLMTDFLSKKYLYTAAINLTTDECVLLQCRRDYFPTFPVTLTFDGFLDGTIDFVHPIFESQLKDRVSKESLKKIKKTGTPLRVEVLLFYTSTEVYHWAALEFIDVDDGSDNDYFILTVSCIDEERAERERKRDALFNKAVMDHLTSNYILVHLVDLNTSMSRLVHSNPGEHYHDYAQGFTSHIELMYDACESFVQPVFQEQLKRCLNYSYVKSQLKDKDDLILIFRDRRDVTLELTITKYPEYSSDNALVVYALKELS